MTIVGTKDESLFMYGVRQRVKMNELSECLCLRLMVTPHVFCSSCCVA